MTRARRALVGATLLLAAPGPPGCGAADPPRQSAQAMSPDEVEASLADSERLERARPGRPGGRR
jgi:hypothetical protein